MTLVPVSHYAIANLLQSQPNNFLDCSAMPLTVFIAERRTHMTVASLRLITFPNALTDEPEYLIEVLFPQDPPTTRPLTFLSASNATATFNFRCDDPILKKVPTTPLFPPEHPLHDTRQIPISPTYNCTLEETRQILAHYMPDLSPETFQSWQAPLEISVLLTWPSPSMPAHTTQFPHERYTFNAHSTSQVSPIRIDVLESADGVYALRNRVVLSAIFPHLAPLCAWALSLYPAQPLQGVYPLTSLPPGLNVTHLIAYPTQPPHAEINSGTAPTHPYLHMRDYFPLSFSKPKAYDPKNPQPSPSEIFHRIRKGIETAKLADLRC